MNNVTSISDIMTMAEVIFTLSLQIQY